MVLVEFLGNFPAAARRESAAADQPVQELFRKGSRRFAEEN
jgi:hypothetical protein